MDNGLLHRGLTTALAVVMLTAACSYQQSSTNPFLTDLNEMVPYADVSAEDVSAYGEIALEQASARAEAIRNVDEPTFENVVGAFDDLYNDLNKAANNSWMLYWVSPDSLTRVAGLAAYQELDSLITSLFSDKPIFDQVVLVAESEDLAGVRKTLVNDLMRDMKHTGVNLEPVALERFRALTREINELSSQYSINMNTANPVLTLDEAGVEGLPDNFKSRYKTDDGTYEVPVIAANRGPVLDNAIEEETRKAFAMAYANRAVEENLEILDLLVAKRYEIGQVMGYGSYADYKLEVNMARNPKAVWSFVDDLIDRTGGKATEDLARLKATRKAATGKPLTAPMKPWDTDYYRNEILKNEYNLDSEAVREYLPLDAALTGMMELYQELLGLEFRKVENPSVWHEEVELYDVLEDGTLVGRFYLDLFPRPNKESWFYGVGLTAGSEQPGGYEIPVSMLLGNFTRSSDDLPSLVSHSELRILFHEFGHIAGDIAYKGEFALQAGSRADFGEAMAQIFENWIWDYDALSSFAAHYETGEVLPQETFDNMLAAKNVTSGLGAQGGLRRAVYDLMLYNKYDPAKIMPTDDIWRSISRRFVLSDFIEGTHPQASWIHINTHPVYYYGYLWSRVYAQDMFTQFEANGLRDTETGKRYRLLILANGTQRDIEEAVEEFLGRPANNEAYIRSLGL
jgi:Zn-dependent oligopeptidase